MFTKVSVLIPTRGRVQRLQTLIDSFNQTVRNGNAELVFKIDPDDQESANFLLTQAVTTLTSPRGSGYLDMPQYFNDLADLATGDVLMCGNDDMVFRTDDWPSMILKAANCFPDGLFDLGVDTLNTQNYPFATVSKLVVDRLGFLWDPRVFWGDIFLRDVMMHFDRCVLLPGVQIDHDWAGFKPDKTYLDQLEPGEFTKDILRRQPNYWETVHRGAVEEAVNKLKGYYHGQ